MLDYIKHILENWTTSKIENVILCYEPGCIDFSWGSCPVQDND